MPEPSVSICTIAMNRLHHVQKTLPVNLAQNADPRVNFVVFDYNSNDGLGEYVKSNFREQITNGTLVYYRYNDAPAFDRCHSRNMALRLADGDIVCNIDADNYAGPGFGKYVQGVYSEKKNVVLTGLDNVCMRDASGKLCVTKADFLEVTGYDENFEGYGYEDYDIVNRLKLNGCTPLILDAPEYLKAITHKREERLNNESVFRQFHAIYVHFMDPSRSELLLLLKNGRLVSGIVENNYTKHCDNKEYVIRKKVWSDFQFDIPGGWHEGIWSMEKEQLHLVREKAHDVCFGSFKEGQEIRANDKNVFYKVQSSSMTLEAISFFTETRNRQIMMENITRKNIKVNKEYGKGVVYKNFIEHEPIEI